MDTSSAIRSPPIGRPRLVAAAHQDQSRQGGQLPRQRLGNTRPGCHEYGARRRQPLLAAGWQPPEVPVSSPCRFRRRRPVVVICVGRRRRPDVKCRGRDVPCSMALRIMPCDRGHRTSRKKVSTRICMRRSLSLQTFGTSTCMRRASRSTVLTTDASAGSRSSASVFHHDTSLLPV